MDMKIEVVILPVTDVDRAKAFYAEKIGFNVDHDVEPGNGMRVLQLTPPGSGCSIVMGTGMEQFDRMTPGSIKGLHLVVDDINAVRETLAGHSVDVSEVIDMGDILFAGFSDPDGNTWVLQQISVGR